MNMNNWNFTTVYNERGPEMRSVHSVPPVLQPTAQTGAAAAVAEPESEYIKYWVIKQTQLEYWVTNIF